MGVEVEVGAGGSTDFIAIVSCPPGGGGGGVVWTVFSNMIHNESKRHTGSSLRRRVSVMFSTTG